MKKHIIVLMISSLFMHEVHAYGLQAGDKHAYDDSDTEEDESNIALHYSDATHTAWDVLWSVFEDFKYICSQQPTYNMLWMRGHYIFGNPTFIEAMQIAFDQNVLWPHTLIVLNYGATQDMFSKFIQWSDEVEDLKHVLGNDSSLSANDYNELEDIRNELEEAIDGVIHSIKIDYSDVTGISYDDL